MSIVKVVYAYRAVHIPKGKRNERKSAVKGEVFVDLREASDAEAPVACRIAPAHYRGHSHRIPQSKMHDYRHSDGRFWEPVQNYRAGRDPTHLSLEEFATDALTGQHFPRDEETLHERPVDLDSLAPCRFLSNVEADSIEMAHRIRQEALNYLVVDGRLWRPTEEPMLRLHRWGNFQADYVDLEVEPATNASPDERPDSYFNMADLEKATAALALARREAFDKRPIRKRDKMIEVLRPELFTFRYDMRPRVEKVASQIIEKMRGGLANADLSYMADYVKLRDMMKEAPVPHAEIVDLIASKIVPLISNDEERRWRWPEGTETVKSEWDRWAERGPRVEEHDLEALGLTASKVA